MHNLHNPHVLLLHELLSIVIVLLEIHFAEHFHVLRWLYRPIMILHST